MAHVPDFNLRGAVYKRPHVPLHGEVALRTRAYVARAQAHLFNIISQGQIVVGEEIEGDEFGGKTKVGFALYAKTVKQVEGLVVVDIQTILRMRRSRRLRKEQG